MKLSGFFFFHFWEKELGFDVAGVQNAALQADFVPDTSHCGPL